MNTALTTAWWVGGYGTDLGGMSAGVGLLVPRSDGSLEYSGAIAETASPSFLVSDGGSLYAAAEGDGRVAAFSIRDDASGALTSRGSVSSGGSGPCHLAVIGNVVLASNYGDGSLGVVRREPFELLQSVAGSGVAPHAHATLALDAATVASLDLGTDSIHLSALVRGRLSRSTTVHLSPGTGPRDICRLGRGRFLVLGELACTILDTRWDGGTLAIASVLDLPGAALGDHAAAIAIGNGFVYVGLRGSDRVSVLSIVDDARLEPVGWISAEGQWPRHLAVDGATLHVANEHSSTVASFRVGADGIPRLLAAPAPVPSPTYLLPVPSRAR